MKLSGNWKLCLLDQMLVFKVIFKSDLTPKIKRNTIILSVFHMNKAINYIFLKQNFEMTYVAVPEVLSGTKTRCVRDSFRAVFSTTAPVSDFAYTA